jgi:signal transduction histidine kinase/ligand-binding sensor domain-containing protein
MRWMLAGALCPCAFGLNPALDIDQYAHQPWTVREGSFKGSIYAIAQMPDGYLWLGTEFGLERFDGVRSVPWQPPRGDHLPGGRIRSLLAARDGRLWIGTDEGLASWKGGKLTHYAEFAGKTVLSILEDRAATIWAAAWSVASTGGRLCTIRDGRVQCYGDDGSLGHGIDGLYEDREGKLWAGTVEGVWRWKPEPAKFFPMPIVTSSFAEDDGGELFITTLDGIRTLVNEQAGPYLVRAHGQLSKFGKLLRDRDGGLWVGTYDGGLLHEYRGRTRRFTHSDGLSGDSIRCLFEDREGNMWVGTRDGLDRFREFAVPAITEKQGLSNSFVGSVVHARDGSMWFATMNGLDQWKDGNVAVYGVPDGLPDAYAQSLYEDRAGRIWVSTRRGLVYLERGKFVPVPAVQSGSIVCIVGDEAGGIWISDQRSLYHLEGRTVVEEIPWTKLGRQDFAWIILPDPVRGGLWLGFRQGGLAYYKDHAVRMWYGREQGFGEGQVSALKLDDDGAIWAATGNGLNLIRNGHTFRLSSANGLPCDIVHWVLEDNDHFFWLYTACGLVRVARSELEKWVADPKRTVSTTVLDNPDGVRSSLTPTDSNPIVAKSADGKIWFLPKDGVSVIDPRHLAVNQTPPPVHVEEIIADESSRWQNLTPLAPARASVPALTHRLEIRYTALSLVAPEQVRFKYMLEGYDREWQDARNRRQAFYTNLPPRRYRFRVIASNNSSVWNETGDTLELLVAPAYYQTSWFLALCAGAFLAAVWGLYRLRLYQVAREFNAQLDGRVDERLRVARDLHDTLLQTFQAALIQMQAAYNMFSRRPEKAVETLQKAITSSAGAIAEGREAIQNMRSSAVTKNDLARALRVAGDQMAAGGSAIFDVRVQGSSRDVHPILRDEVYRIALEAMRNAFHHAEAKAIEAEIVYGDSLQVRIRDDGKGIDPAVMKEGRSGHFGLAGMRERAKHIGGKLDLWSGPGAGTEVQLSIPGTIAFARSGAGSLLRRFQRKSRGGAPQS